MAEDAGFECEAELYASGRRVIVGIDEVGRGAWAGCVTVGAAVAGAASVRGLRDSKLLSERQRRERLEIVHSWSPEVALGHASAVEIDELGMTAALRLAAMRALGELESSGFTPDVVLLDGKHDYLRLPGVEVKTLVKGDLRVQTIAAASIVAKVWRDQHLAEVAGEYPHYGFEQNAGYPAPSHLAGLDAHGLCEIHRQSWIFAEGRPGRVRWPRDQQIQMFHS